MNWLKGLVAPAAQYMGQQAQPGMMPPQQQGMGMPMDAPPMGGAPNPYGVQGQMPGQQPPQQMPPTHMGSMPDPNQWSTGTKTQGGLGAQQAQGATSNLSGGGASGDRVAQLENDIAHLALFARTLLTVLEESKVMTREQFMETKNRLDMLDGKMDDK